MQKPKGKRAKTSNNTYEVLEMKRVIRRYELRDEEWERLKKYFPERQPGTMGRPRKEPRDMLNGIFWIARSGAAWRDLPERYGPWQTVYKRFVEWQKSGLIEKIFHELGEDADLEDISIDSTYIKAHKAYSTPVWRFTQSLRKSHHLFSYLPDLSRIVSSFLPRQSPLGRIFFYRPNTS